MTSGIWIVYNIKYLVLKAVVLDIEKRKQDLISQYDQIQDRINTLTSEQLITEEYDIDTAQTKQRVKSRDITKLYKQQETIFNEIMRLERMMMPGVFSNV